jgi:hypothetical protein
VAKIPGYRVINGSFGALWWDGNQVFEVESFELTVTPNREDVNQAGSMDVDSKITSLKGEGKFRVKKVFSRGLTTLLSSWKQGKDPRSQLIGKLADPDSYGSERVVVDNVWFNQLTLMEFEVNKKLDREFTFGFTASNVSFPDTIAVQEG